MKLKLQVPQITNATLDRHLGPIVRIEDFRSKVLSSFKVVMFVKLYVLLFMSKV